MVKIFPKLSNHWRKFKHDNSVNSMSFPGIQNSVPKKILDCLNAINSNVSFVKGLFQNLNTRMQRSLYLNTTARWLVRLLQIKHNIWKAKSIAVWNYFKSQKFRMFASLFKSNQLFKRPLLIESTMYMNKGTKKADTFSLDLFNTINIGTVFLTITMKNS